MAVQADQPQMRRRRDPVDRGRRLPQPEAELRVGLAGRDRRVRLTEDVGRDADQDILGGGPLGRHLLEPVGVIQRVEHDVADAGIERELELGC